jgi:hypothetical protein
VDGFDRLSDGSGDLQRREGARDDDEPSGFSTAKPVEPTHAQQRLNNKSTGLPKFWANFRPLIWVHPGRGSSACPACPTLRALRAATTTAAAAARPCAWRVAARGCGDLLWPSLCRIILIWLIIVGRAVWWNTIGLYHQVARGGCGSRLAAFLAVASPAGFALMCAAAPSQLARVLSHT